MKIRTSQYLATFVAIAGIIWIGYFVLRAEADDAAANNQLQQAIQVVKGLTEMRILAIDYQNNPQSLDVAQWLAVSAQLSSVLASDYFADHNSRALISGLRTRIANSETTFNQIVATADGRNSPSSNEVHMQLAALSAQLIMEQRGSLKDAFAVANIASTRMQSTQVTLRNLSVAGLILFAIIVIGRLWLVERKVLAPIAKLRQATRELADGNWDHKIEIDGKDEIADLAANFNAMARALHDAFGQINDKNLKLSVLNQDLEAFSYSVSHDLRGPLRALDGFSTILLKEHHDQLSEDAREVVIRIQLSGKRMATLIDDLLGLAQVTRVGINAIDVDLSAIANEIADELNQTQANRRVEWVIESDMNVRADPALLRIAIQNLMQNAWKYTSKTSQPVIHIGSAQETNKMVYFVADNGAGFNMAYADKLFNAFQRMHHTDDFPGTGIGLTIVQRIIRRHGGEIRAEAKVGEGATFFFDLQESVQKQPKKLRLAA